MDIGYKDKQNIIYTYNGIIYPWKGMKFWHALHNQSSETKGQIMYCPT